MLLNCMFVSYSLISSWGMKALPSSISPFSSFFNSEIPCEQSRAAFAFLSQIAYNNNSPKQFFFQRQRNCSRIQSLFLSFLFLSLGFFISYEQKWHKVSPYTYNGSQRPTAASPLWLICENRGKAEANECRSTGGQEWVRTVDGCCPDRGDSTFSSDEEKKDFKIESKDRNSPSGELFRPIGEQHLIRMITEAMHTIK